MIKRFSTEIIDHGLSDFCLEDKVVINKEYYVSFFRNAYKLDLCYDIMENVSIKCATCNSYIVDLYVLYDVIEEVLASSDCKDMFILPVFGTSWNMGMIAGMQRSPLFLIEIAPVSRCLWENPKKIKTVRLTLTILMVVSLNTSVLRDIGHR